MLLLFFIFTWRGLKIALMAPDTFGSLLAAGITAMIAVQALVNIAVVTGSIPVTGINLPLSAPAALGFLYPGRGGNIAKHLPPCAKVEEGSSTPAIPCAGNSGLIFRDGRAKRNAPHPGLPHEEGARDSQKDKVLYPVSFLRILNSPGPKPGNPE